MIGLISLLISTALADPMTDQEYQRRLSSLKESQAQAQSLLTKVGGFNPSASIGGTSKEEAEAEAKKSLFKVHTDFKTVRIKTGSIYRAVNQNRIMVGTEVAPSMLALTDGQGTLSGLKLLGNAHPSGITGRIQMDVTRLVLSSGRVIPVQAVALNSTGTLGLEAEVISGKALAVAGAVASSFVSGLAASQQVGTVSPFGMYQNQPSGRNAIFGGLAQTAADQSKRLIDEATQEKPILILEAGATIAILFNEEARF